MYIFIKTYTWDYVLLQNQSVSRHQSMEPMIRETLVLRSVSCYLCTVYCNYPTSGALSQIHSARKVQPVCQCVCFSVCPPGYLSPACLSVCLSLCRYVCLTICLYVSMSVFLSVCLPVCLYLCPSACLSVSPSVSQSVSLSVYQSACQSVCHSLCQSV
jgi:hypothetical protein